MKTHAAVAELAAELARDGARVLVGRKAPAPHFEEVQAAPLLPQHIQARAEAFAVALEPPTLPPSPLPRAPDAQCSECGAMYYSGEGHPTLTLCRPCWRPSR